MGKPSELDLYLAIRRLCESLGFKLDMKAPSHVAAWEEFCKALGVNPYGNRA